MATTVKNYLDDGIVSFAFPKIIMKLNEKGILKKKPIDMPSWKPIRDFRSSSPYSSHKGIIRYYKIT